MDSKEQQVHETILSREFVNWYNDPQRMFIFNVPEQSASLDSSKTSTILKDKIQSEAHKRCKSL